MSCGLPAGARPSLVRVRTLQPKWRTQVPPAAPPTDYQTVAAPGGRTNTRTNTRTCSRANPFRQCFTPKAKNVQAARENFTASRKKISAARKCFTACRYYLVSPLVRLQVRLSLKKYTLIFRHLSARCKRCHLLFFIDCRGDYDTPNTNSFSYWLCFCNDDSYFNIFLPSWIYTPLAGGTARRRPWRS